MGTVQRNNRTVGYQVNGQGAALLVFHGTTQEANGWDPVRTVMPIERQWIAVEFPGSGESSMSDGPIDIDDIVADAVAVLETLGITECDVAGYSLGAVVALKFAATHPNKTRTVTSLCGWAKTDARMRLTFDLWRRLIAIDPELFMRYALADGYTADGLTALEPMLEMAISLAATTIQPGSDAQLELDIRIDIEQDLSKITAPALIIGGIEDRWVDITHSRHLATAIKGATLVEMPAGHIVIAELAGDVAARLASHIA